MSRSMPVSRWAWNSRVVWQSLHVLSATDLSFPFNLNPLCMRRNHVLVSYGLENVFWSVRQTFFVENGAT
eukprot:5010867-Pleurochrysis_carterae.AAC.1